MIAPDVPKPNLYKMSMPMGKMEHAMSIPMGTMGHAMDMPMGKTGHTMKGMSSMPTATILGGGPISPRHQ